MKRRIVTFLVLAATGSAVLAQALPGTPAEYLKRMDANGDGKVSEAEYVDYMSAGFRRMDINDDGVLDANDGPMRPGARPVRLDEFQRNLIHQFHKLDRNHDGFLNARELTQPPQE
ncbi:EF hand domain-containing protein [Luteibacter rhizovicinus]|uniref:EF hand domain-containing protein n=1 Tax=Luteibacter rhizovicinus TaxID=242606 RepID=A0A4R3YSU5_9GAMM|nr:hypothetical protein [Luteibacter rhizovicinus]TCV96075.1 EF hand domain-containing protein [Luteibacter rhizovicinus]